MWCWVLSDLLIVAEMVGKKKVLMHLVVLGAF